MTHDEVFVIHIQASKQLSWTINYII